MPGTCPASSPGASASGTPRRRAWALTGVDLVVEPGERVLLTGASGAGKSTLLAALAGILDPEGAEVTGELDASTAAPRHGPRRASGCSPRTPTASWS